MKVLNVDYDNCITNLTSSIQKYYGMTPNYKTNDIVDDYLSKNDYDNVIIFVFDAMGNSILDKNTTSNHYLIKHRISSMTSTYPPTTANCTINYLSGLNPISSGWLGWATYYEDLDMVVDNFTNKENVTKNLIPGDNIALDRLKFEHLGTKIERYTNGSVKYHCILPKRADKNGYISLSECANRISKICSNGTKNYIYAYYDEPDRTMHDEGTNNRHVKSILRKTLKYIESHTKKTIVFVSADHSMINVAPIAMYTYYDLLATLKATCSGDARTPIFHVKEGMEKDFERLFDKYFGDYFDLYTKDEVEKLGIFGPGEKHPLFDKIMGQYLAVAKDKYYIMNAPDGHMFAGHHAGATKDEADIPLIVVTSK